MKRGIAGAGMAARAEALAAWTIPPTELPQRLGSTEHGLTSAQARDARAQWGPNALEPARRSGAWLLLAQFRSPIVLVLLAAAVLSFVLGSTSDGVIIVALVFASAGLGFWQEYTATDAVARLLATVQVTARVLRDGAPIDLPPRDIVPGDVLVLAAGDVIAADAVLLEARDLSVDEAAITGESFPADKSIGALAHDTPPAKRSNAIYMGTHVISGTARAMVTATGAASTFGAITRQLATHTDETEFERGVRHFGGFLLEVTLLLVLAIFAGNVYLHRPVLDSLLFAVALAVGLTPQLLPAVIAVNLAHGARRLAALRVIVKHLPSIENLGSMTVLCTDKTGTLTAGTVRIDHAEGIDGGESARVLQLAALNARHATGFDNPIDRAIRALPHDADDSYRKLDELPYDFHRKRLSVLLAAGDARWMVTKGALRRVVDACSHAVDARGDEVDIAAVREAILQRADALADEGFRVLGVAYRTHGLGDAIGPSDEVAMIFAGVLVLGDPPKDDAARVIRRLETLGVRLKIVSGDAMRCALHVARALEIPVDGALAGSDIDALSDAALVQRARNVSVFAEVEPRHKERIVRALRTGREVVGFLGDGVNDATAIHAADVGISVDAAVDVAKEAAAIVMLDRDLGALADGVAEGRRTFANTLKYVFMATSANFGNMASMAAASLYLPFLPLLPKQVLLTNLLTDLPEMTIATDRVDPELVTRPRRWNVAVIRRFMIVFGLLSSVFDLATFGALRLASASPAMFRTGWFVESVVSASLNVLVIRSRRSIVRSRPSRGLLVATVCVATVAAVLPFTAIGALFGFTPLPPAILAIVGAIVVVYVCAAEVTKRVFYREHGPSPVASRLPSPVGT